MTVANSLRLGSLHRSSAMSRWSTLRRSPSWNSGFLSGWRFQHRRAWPKPALDRAAELVPRRPDDQLHDGSRDPAGRRRWSDHLVPASRAPDRPLRGPGVLIPVDTPVAFSTRACALARADRPPRTLTATRSCSFLAHSCAISRTCPTNTDQHPSPPLSTPVKTGYSSTERWRGVVQFRRMPARPRSPHGPDAHAASRPQPPPVGAPEAARASRKRAPRHLPLHRASVTLRARPRSAPWLIGHPGSLYSPE
jgi:hypothetical protein